MRGKAVRDQGSPGPQRVFRIVTADQGRVRRQEKEVCRERANARLEVCAQQGPFPLTSEDQVSITSSTRVMNISLQ